MGLLLASWDEAHGAGGVGCRVCRGVLVDDAQPARNDMGERTCGPRCALRS